MSLVGDILSPVAGIGSTMLNYGAQQSANRTNLQIARDNRDFYYQQWQRENAYNDPSAQMERLARAGLNPNLMYGEGAGGLAASATMQNVDPGRVVAPQVDPLMLAQIANINADTEKKKTESKVNEVDADYKRNQIKVGDSVILRNTYLNAFTDAQRKNIEGQTDMLAVETQKLNSEIAANYATIQNMSVNSFISMCELSLRSREVEASINKMAADTQLTNEQCKYVGMLAYAKVNNMNADTLLKGLQGDLTVAQRRQCDQIVENLKVENGKLSWDLQMDKKYGDTQRQLSIYSSAAGVVSSISNASKVSMLGVTFNRENFQNGLVSDMKSLVQ